MAFFSEEKMDLGLYFEGAAPRGAPRKQNFDIRSGTLIVKDGREEKTPRFYRYIIFG